jgi:tellurite resistance protein
MIIICEKVKIMNTYRNSRGAVSEEDIAAATQKFDDCSRQFELRVEVGQITKRRIVLPDGADWVERKDNKK